MGGRSAGRSAKFGVVVFKASMLNWGGVDLLADLPILNSFTFHALLHRRSFRITYERPKQSLFDAQLYDLEHLPCDYDILME